MSSMGRSHRIRRAVTALVVTVFALLQAAPVLALDSARGSTAKRTRSQRLGRRAVPQLLQRAATVNLAIGGFTLVESVRVGRVEFQYTYRATVTNLGTVGCTNVQASVVSASGWTAIVDGNLTFPDVPAGASAQSTDTFSFRQNRLYPFDWNNLTWTVTGTPGTVNTAPVADAGADQTSWVGGLVQLDGSGSTDVDGDPLSYAWTLVTRPSGSAAALSDPAAVSPSFTVDRFGDYVAQLVVNDGTVDSAPDTVAISTLNSAPVADAGPDQTVYVTGTVQLDGSGSRDMDGDPLGFFWTLVTRPSGSAAALSDPAAVAPTFVADKPGTYEAQLIVNDGTVDSAPEAVVISTQNSAPVANAGPDQVVSLNDTVQLDGSGSGDVDGDPLGFFWSLTARPAGSAAALSDGAAVAPTFQADSYGTYVAQLIVNDGIVDSAPDTVVITAPAPGNRAPTAQADGYAVDEGVQLIVGPAGVLGNDSDPDGNPLSALLETGPAHGALTLNADGSFTYTPAGDDNGPDSFAYRASDGSLSSDPATVSITVSPVNDLPGFTKGADQTVNEDAGAQSVAAWATGITDGDPEVAQALSFNVSNDNPGLFAVQPAVAADGTLSYTPAADANGSATVSVTLQDGGGTANGGEDTSAVQTFTITVSAVNDAPSFAKGANQTVNEDAGAQSVPGWATGIGDGDPEVTQTLSFAATNNNNALFSVQPAVAANGTLTYTPAANANGTTTVSVTLTDDATAGGAAITTAAQTFTITVTPVNDLPGFTKGANQTVNEDAGAQSVAGWATGIGDGDAEVTQTLSFAATNNNNALFSVQPAVAANGTLTFTPAANANGSATVSVTLTDDATAGGAALTSAAQTFTITVSAVNDAPSFTKGANQTVDENSGAQTVAGWATAISDGDPDVAQALTFTATNDNNALFSAQPAVSPAGTLTYTPATAATGSATVSVTLTDDATAGGAAITTAALTFTITVRPVVLPPTTITLSPKPAQMVSRGTLTMTATLDRAAGTGGLLVNLSANNSRVTVPATVTVPEGQLSATFDITSGVTLGTATVSASATGLTGDSSQVTVVGRDYELYAPLVGLDRTVKGRITLSAVAPAGGATFQLSVDNTTLVNVSPASVTIPAGQTTITFDLIGGSSIGITTLRSDGQASGYLVKTREISVTNRLIDLPAVQQLALGEEVTIQVLIAPDPAPAGGVEIAVESSDTSIVQVLTPVVTVAEGQLSANVTIRAAAGKTGQAVVTASNAAFAPDMTTIAVTAALDILQTTTFLGSAETEKLYVRIDSGGEPYPAPAGGVALTFASDNTACVSATANVTVAAGQVYGAANLSYGGSAPLPCTATVTASSPLFSTDTAQVTVTDQAPDLGALTIQDIHHGDHRIGSGVGKPYRVSLATSSHGGVKVQVMSSDPTVLRLAASATTVWGTPVLELTIPNGQYYADFHVRGAPSATGAGKILTAKCLRFSTGTDSIDVVPGAFNFVNLDSSGTTLDPDDPFYMQVGYMHSNGTSFQWAYASADRAITLTSSDTGVGVLKTTAATGPSVTVTVPLGQYYSPTSVAAGGVALDPVGAGTTTITAASAGFTSRTASVTLSQPGMTLADTWYGDYRTGTGVAVTWRVTLGGSSHGGVTVTVASSDASKALLAPSSTAAGSATIDLSIPDGQTYKDFYVQGVGIGSATISATQTLFTGTSRTVDVVVGAMLIHGLSATTTSLSPDDPFYVRVGYMHSNGTSFRYASANGGSPVTVTLTSSSTSVGVLKTTAATGSPVTVTVDGGLWDSPGSVASGGVAFDPVGGGMTTVTASATGFSGTSASVTVTQPAITLYDNHYGDYRTGTGVAIPWYFSLGGSDHGGVTVTVTSSDPTKALLAANSTTAGGTSVNITVPNGQTSGSFYVQGVGIGSSTITASQALFTPDSKAVEVVSGAMQIYSLDTTTTSLSPDDPFYVRVGYMHSNGTSFRYAFANGGSPVTVTLTSSSTSVGVLKTTAATGSPVTVTVASGQYDSPGSVASGGVAFDPVGGGTTEIAASATGFTGTTASVTVSQPGMTVTDTWWGDYRTGTGVEASWRVTLGGPSHGGVTVTVASSDATKVLLAPSSTAAGSATIDLSIPDGQTYKDFYVQGVGIGSATISATQALFTGASHAVDVGEGALLISSLNSPTNSYATDNPFYVQIGYLNGTSFHYAYANGGSTVTVALASSNTAVGVLKTSGTSGATATVTVAGGQYYSPTSVAAGGVAFDAVAAGSTTITAAATGFGSKDLTIVVDEPGFTLTDVWWGDYRVGGGLQINSRLSVSGPSHGGITVRVASDPLKLRPATGSTSVGTSFIDLYIPNGQTYLDFYLQAINGASGTATVTASLGGIEKATRDFTVVPAVLQIHSLAASIAASAADDHFYVRSGYMDSAGTSFHYTPVSGAGDLHAIVASSSGTVGKLRTAAAYDANVTVDIKAGNYDSAGTVATGGIAFDPLSSGTTTVSATAVGFGTFSGSSQVVTVNP